MLVILNTHTHTHTDTDTGTHTHTHTHRHTDTHTHTHTHIYTPHTYTHTLSHKAGWGYRELFGVKPFLFLYYPYKHDYTVRKGENDFLLS